MERKAPNPQPKGTDIVYVVGGAPKHNDQTLRWSLRSLEKFGRNVGRVIVAGRIPEWVSGEVVQVPVAEPPPPSDIWLVKHRNILNCIFAAIGCCGIEGDFLYSSDDHFLMRKVDFADYPVYLRGERIETYAEYQKRTGKSNKWRQSLSDTRDLLERNGYNAAYFAFHANTHMDARDAAEVKRLAEQEPVAMYGYEPTCLFLNVKIKRDPRMHIVPRRDFKVKKFHGEQSLMARLGDLDSFSCGDRVFETTGFQQMMDKWFPKPCKWEVE